MALNFTFAVCWLITIPAMFVVPSLYERRRLRLGHIEQQTAFGWTCEVLLLTGVVASFVLTAVYPAKILNLDPFDWIQILVLISLWIPMLQMLLRTRHVTPEE